ncbi:hypothetical protein GH714_037211 [Hevea brasiliensis]|uniref:Reverse transcriptase Ty1/copia-type domain-containing protein n=1 Tax=Hevea brasiliensis TaxID=3981 RepID=A0A6A6L751_HEVBR|nr:hypothetical protein GH714_037211 [Hevea brasiliensis]
MTTCKSLSTPATPNEKLQATGVESAPDITLYRTIVGALQYLNITRPDIALSGTQWYGLLLTPSSNLDIHAYSDADWASNLDDRKSTSGYVIFMGSNLISRCDNVGATYLTANPIFHSRIKHVEVDYHFVRDKVANKDLQVRYISSKDQVADVLTKPLPSSKHADLWMRLTILTSPG